MFLLVVLFLLMHFLRYKKLRVNMCPHKKSLSYIKMMQSGSKKEVEDIEQEILNRIFTSSGTSYFYEFFKSLHHLK